MILIGDVELDLSGLTTYLDIVQALCNHPELAATRAAFLSRVAEQRNDAGAVCCVLQGERATVGNEFAWVTSDEATTCHIVAFRAPSGVTSLAHLDGRGQVADLGSLRCMVKDVLRSTAADVESDALRDDQIGELASDAPIIDVYVVGGYDDERRLSEEISVTLVQALHELPLKFRVVLYCAMSANTRTLRAAEHSFRFSGWRDDDPIRLPRAVALSVAPDSGDALPFAVPLPAGSVVPLHALRKSAIFGGAQAMGRSPHVIQVWDRFRGCFSIPPLAYGVRKRRPGLTDEYIRFNMSTSPLAEAPAFEAGVRASLDFLEQNPDWRVHFPDNRPRLFDASGRPIE